jgi:hypothetical protein
VKERAMADPFGDVWATRRLEEAIWARFDEAAVKANCPTDQIKAYYGMVLDLCKPRELQENPRGWDDGPLPKLTGPKPEKEALQAQYRIALSEMLACLDMKALEETFAAVARDAKLLAAGLLLPSVATARSSMTSGASGHFRGRLAKG